MLSPLFFFHPEGNDDQVAFCTCFTYNTMTVWTNCWSARIQGCRPCELGPKVSLLVSGSSFSPDLPMVTHTALPGSPRPAVSGDLCKVSGHFCPKHRFCLRLSQPAPPAAEIQAQGKSFCSFTCGFHHRHFPALSSQPPWNRLSEEFPAHSRLITPN